MFYMKDRWSSEDYEGVYRMLVYINVTLKYYGDVSIPLSVFADRVPLKGLAGWMPLFWGRGTETIPFREAVGVSVYGWLN